MRSPERINARASVARVIREDSSSFEAALVRRAPALLPATLRCKARREDERNPSAMLTSAQNERLTRIGRGTPMGETLRRYWQPALLSEELPENDGSAVRVRLLGEDLIAFRDSTGGVGLVDAYCPHRRAPMFFGRNEERGLRCVYHGWKFDRRGACTDMPSEPPDSAFKEKVRIMAYPTWEGGGVVWGYLGPPKRMPPPPDYEWVRAPIDRRFVSKTHSRCNWLQGLEGGLDTTHSQFAHNERLGDRSWIRNRVTAPPTLEVETTAYGYTYSAVRDMGDEGHYVRLYQYIMPAQQLRGNLIELTGGRTKMPKIDGHIWVPIDDENTWVYNMMYAYDAETPWSEEGVWDFETLGGRGKDQLLPGYRLKANRDNDYFIDRERQKTKTFTGIVGINTQDLAIQEGMGPIADRSREHLGTSDKAVIVMRQLLFEALDAVDRGASPKGCDPHTYRHVRPYDNMVPSGADWRRLFESELVAKW